MPMKFGTKVITFRVDENLKFDIEKRAFVENRSVNNLLQHIVKEYLDNQNGKKMGSK